MHMSLPPSYQTSQTNKNTNLGKVFTAIPSNDGQDSNSPSLLVSDASTDGNYTFDASTTFDINQLEAPKTKKFASKQQGQHILNLEGYGSRVKIATEFKSSDPKYIYVYPDDHDIIAKSKEEIKRQSVMAEDSLNQYARENGRNSEVVQKQLEYAKRHSIVTELADGSFKCEPKDPSQVPQLMLSTPNQALRGPNESEEEFRARVQFATAMLNDNARYEGADSPALQRRLRKLAYMGFNIRQLDDGSYQLEPKTSKNTSLQVANTNSNELAPPLPEGYTVEKGGRVARVPESVDNDVYVPLLPAHIRVVKGAIPRTPESVDNDESAPPLPEGYIITRGRQVQPLPADIRVVT